MTEGVISMFPILLFALAGALITGGTGGGVLLWNKARQKAAEEELKGEHYLKAAALRASNDLEELKNEAKAAGVNVEEVLKGVEAAKNGQVSIAEVSTLLSRQRKQLDAGN